jgi:hypothetical protein
VVIGEDVGEPQFLDALAVRAKDGGVRAELGLREDDSDAHLLCNHVASGLLPAQRKTQRTSPRGKIGTASSSHLWRKWSLEATVLMWCRGMADAAVLIKRARRRDIQLPVRVGNRLQA